LRPLSNRRHAQLETGPSPPYHRRRFALSRKNHPLSLPSLRLALHLLASRHDRLAAAGSHATSCTPDDRTRRHGDKGTRGRAISLSPPLLVSPSLFDRSPPTTSGPALHLFLDLRLPRPRRRHPQRQPRQRIAVPLACRWT